MLEWLWPWVFAAAPLPWLVYRLSKGESLQPSALRPVRRQMARLGGRQPRHAIGPRVLVAVMADLDDVDRRDCATTVDW